MVYREETANLNLFAVHKLQRRRGIGAAVLRWLEECAITAGIGQIGVQARADNLTALSFYSGQGFEVVKKVKRMYGGMEDGVRLGKRIWSSVNLESLGIDGSSPKTSLP